MKTSNKGKMALIVSEGIVNAPYLDSVGVWTIGVGVTKSAGDIDPAKHVGKKFELDYLIKLFDKVLPTYEKIVNDNVKVPLAQHEYDALVHFVYNIGGPNFKKSKLLKNLNEGNKKEAWASGFHGWLKPPELKGRRDKERKIAQTGDYGSTIAPLYTADAKGKLKRIGTADLKKYFSVSDISTPTSVHENNSEAPSFGTNLFQIIIKIILRMLGK